MKFANDKLQKYCSHMPEFVGTPEDPQTLVAIMEMEQMYGKEIIWLRGESFDKRIEYKKALPNQNSRWCTQDMKLKVVFDWWFTYVGDPCIMQIGYRYDELERANRFTTSYNFPYACNLYGQNRQKWREIEWRLGEFPLIEDKIIHKHVIDFWKDKIQFPMDSNCQMCFWKNPQQLRKNFDTNPAIMQWAKRKEKETGNRLKHDMSLEEIEQLGLQMDFNFGTGSGCQAGFCTD